MAFRSGVGKVFGFLRPRWGVRGSLFAAFAVIAAMAIVISAGAGYVLQQIGVRMVDLSGRDIPRLAASLQLSAQAASLAAQSPVMLDAQTQVNAILSSADLSASDANDAAQTIGQLGNVVATGNLAAADLSAALSANSADKLDDIEKEFKTAQGRLRSNLDLLQDNAANKKLREAAGKLLALGTGKTGVFSLREKELDAADYGQTVLEETRKLN